MPTTMEEPSASEAMDAIEERAESTLEVLAVLESAQMMRVTREAIVASLEEEQQQERDRFRALGETPGVDGGRGGAGES